MNSPASAFRRRNGTHWNFYNIVVEPSPVQQPHPPFWLGAGSPGSIRRASREAYYLPLDQIAPTDLVIERVAAFREECRRIGRRYDPAMVGVTRGLHIIHNETERQRAIAAAGNSAIPWFERPRGRPAPAP
jgi:alkanesulfonate monooxygenase SsuD/methylene tetrahydromethanopterin reductase-like flavin-dependent oxidoreductase (luciferase family)